MRYFFEDFALDIERRELRHSDALVALEPQVFDLLAYLVQHRHRVATKDDLISAIWQGRLVSDSALTTRLNAVRGALGDSGDDQRLVRTLRGRGIRFVGEVHELSDAGAGEPLVPLPDRPSIVVLPFSNQSGDPDQEYISDGIAEGIITALSKWRWLFVISLNSSFFFKSGAVDVRQVSRELGVRYVLEGSVRRAKGRVRLTAQLIDTPTGLNIWAEHYDRDPEDIFAIQDEIANAVAAAIGPAIVDAERQRAVRKPPENLGAWEAYQRGLWHVSKHDIAETESARRLFERAFELDPGFAPAYCGMALTYCMSAATFYSMDYAEGCSLAEQFARKAIALDESDADAHAWLGWALFLSGDHEGARQEAEYARSISTNCAEALAVKGSALIFSGHREEGRQTTREFLAISPRDPTRPNRLAMIAGSHYFDRDYESAVQIARQVIRHHPKNVQAYRWLAASFGQLERQEEAKVALDNLQSIAPSFLDWFFATRIPSLRIEDYEHVLDGLRRAGCPGAQRRLGVQ